MKVCYVKLINNVPRDIIKIPLYVKNKLMIWVDKVEYSGIHEARKIRGFRDEALKGQRKGQRSIRLNKAYRAIYIEDDSKKINIISIIEVNKHEY